MKTYFSTTKLESETVIQHLFNNLTKIKSSLQSLVYENVYENNPASKYKTDLTIPKKCCLFQQHTYKRHTNPGFLLFLYMKREIYLTNQ